MITEENSYIPYSAADKMAADTAAKETMLANEAELKRVADEKRQYFNKLHRDGSNAIMAYIEPLKPKDTRSEEDLARRTAKIQAWGDFASALGSGAVGLSSKPNWQPTLENDRPLKMLERADQLKAQRGVDEQNYQKLKMNALLQKLQGEQSIAASEAQDAQSAYDSAVGYRRGLEKEEIDRAEKQAETEAKNKFELKKLDKQNEFTAGQNAINNEARAKAQKAGAGGLILTYPDGSVKVIDQGEEARILSAAQRSGKIMQQGARIDPNDIYNTATFDYDKLDAASKAALLNQALKDMDDEEKYNAAAKQRFGTSAAGRMVSQLTDPNKYMQTPSNTELSPEEQQQVTELKAQGFSDDEINVAIAQSREFNTNYSALSPAAQIYFTDLVNSGKLGSDAQQILVYLQTLVESEKK